MKIFSAMSAVMSDMDAIGKNQKNQQQNFNYRGIDQVYNALHPLLARHKIFTTPEVLEKQREERTNAKGTVLAFVTLRVKYTFWTDDGSSVSCTVEGEGMDSGDKASNKAMAIAHKYALLQTFCIPTEDMPDPDAEVHEVTPRQSQPAPKPRVSPQQEEHIRQALTVAGINEADWCAIAKIPSLDMLPAEKFDGAMAFIKQKAQGDAA
ncbi:ERF family protein [Azotobacter vinelandii]|uniref:ERF family protein n=1 Tax=Azotobacter vinelandii TaxID=354 RepID=UPI000920C4D0|nr:ERF family protein [Azotobacter vinelandii]SFY33052.1 ERF superfamily protein [Azotobacter vinelandii]